MVEQGNVTNVLNAYSYDANGNMTGDNARTITYTSFNKASEITHTNGSLAHFNYGPDRARYKQEKATGQTLYLGKAFERETKNGITKDIHYLSVAGNVIGTVTVHASETTADDILYFHKDHLGSIDVVTRQLSVIDPDRQVFWQLEESMSFGAFGERRQLSWQTAVAPIEAISTTRGYTGHEQLDSVGLIHMNGRVYDAKLGRFMSADPFVQYADSTQSYNRYTYVNNNPLSYTDPSGYLSLKSFTRKLHKAFKKATPYIKAAALMYVSYQMGGAGAYGYASAAASGAIYATMAGGNVIRGALTAMAFYGVGQHYDGVGISDPEAMEYIFAHGVVGGVSSDLSGGKFSAGFWSAAVGKAATLGMRQHFPDYKFAGAVVSGGLASSLAGGKFGGGALMAMMGYLFNEASVGGKSVSLLDRTNKSFLDYFAKNHPLEYAAYVEYADSVYTNNWPGTEIDTIYYEIAWRKFAPVFKDYMKEINVDAANHLAGIASPGAVSKW